MPANRTVEKLAGGLITAGFLAFLLHVITLEMLGAGKVTIFFVFVYGLLIFLTAAALWIIFSPLDAALAGFGAMGLTAHGISIVIVCTMILARFELDRQFPAVEGVPPETAVAAGRALWMSMDAIRTTSFVLLGLGLLPLGVLLARSRVVARWLGWLGVAGGALGFLGMLAMLFGVTAGGRRSILVMAAFLTAFGFLVALGVRLFLWEISPSPPRPSTGG